MKIYTRTSVAVALLLPLLLAGCFTRTLSVKYDATKGSPAQFNVNRKLTVAVFPFADLRDLGPTRMGGIYGPVKELYTEVYMPEKVTVFFGKALADELEQMGFVVIDQVGAPVLPEGVTILREAKAVSRLNPSLDIAIYGQLMKAEVNSFYGYRSELEVKIFILDVNEEKLVWSGTISSQLVDIKTSQGGLLEIMSERFTENLSKGIRDFLRGKEFRKVMTSFL